MKNSDLQYTDAKLYEKLRSQIRFDEFLRCFVDNEMILTIVISQATSQSIDRT